MTHVTCRLTAKNRDQLRNPTLGNREWATFTFFTFYSLGDKYSRNKLHGCVQRTLRGFRDKVCWVHAGLRQVRRFCLVGSGSSACPCSGIWHIAHICKHHSIETAVLYIHHNQKSKLQSFISYSLAAIDAG